MLDLEAKEALREEFERFALAAGKRVEVEMDVDHARYSFTRMGTVVKNMPAPGGHLVVLRLDRAVLYWSWFFRRARWVAVEPSAPSYKMVDGKPVMMADHAYGDVYAVKGTNPEQPFRRWPNLTKRLTLSKLAWLGFAMLRVR